MPYSDPITPESLMIDELHTTYQQSYIEDEENMTGYLSEEERVYSSAPSTPDTSSQ